MKNPIVKTLILIAVSLIVAMLAAMISLGNASESIAELLKPILYPQAQQIAVVSELDTDRNIVSFVEWTSAEGAKHRLEYSTFAVVWTLLLAIPIFLIAKLVVYFRMKSLRTSIESSSHNIPENLKRALDSSSRLEIQQMLKNGNKLQAVKLYREITGASLADAKSAVDSME